MARAEGKKLFEKIRSGMWGKYDEELHCPMILDVMSNEGTMAAFCKKAGISEQLFFQWVSRYKVFGDCYHIGKMISRANWEEEGERGVGDESFNLDYWKLVGASRYGIGKGRVRMAVDAEASPFEQYKQLIVQANTEEFSASEIKQLMESINVGIRAFESFKLQEQVDEMNNEMKRMSIANGNNSSSVEQIKKAD